MLYRLVLALRHLFYDKGWKKRFKAPVPTVCIGNITVGGTGKTPFTEWVLRCLLQSDDWAYSNIAVLSRGYKRKKKGFQPVLFQIEKRKPDDSVHCRHHPMLSRNA